MVPGSWPGDNRSRRASDGRGLPVPLGRAAPPEEIAAAVAFLLGPDASYVHGSVLFVDGGSDAAVRPGAL